MKITVNSIDEFIKLDDLIPNINVLDKYFSKTGEVYLELLNILGNDIDNIFIEYLSKSKNKKLSSLVKTLLDSFGLQKIEDYYIMSDNGIEHINSTIKYRFLTKWKNLGKTLKLNYNPIEPYNMTIHEVGEDSMSNSSTINTTSSDNSSSNENSNSSSQNNQGIYGFNSPSSVPTDTQDGTSNDTTNSTESSNSNRETTSEYERENPYSRDITRTGNIGNTSQQELIKQERELLEYQIIDTIFKDLDSVYTRSKYI